MTSRGRGHTGLEGRQQLLVARVERVAHHLVAGWPQDLVAVPVGRCPLAVRVPICRLGYAAIPSRWRTACSSCSVSTCAALVPPDAQCGGAACAVGLLFQCSKMSCVMCVRPAWAMCGPEIGRPRQRAFQASNSEQAGSAPKAGPSEGTI